MDLSSSQFAETTPAPGGGGTAHEGAKTTAARVAEALRDMIAAEALAPGERLRERELAERLSVSRTPLREALRMLATEGLVETSANRGAVVATLSLAEVEDLLAMLGALEALAGEQATQRASEADIAEVRALHYEMLAAFERDDRMTYFKRNQDIHRAVVTAAKNAPLALVHARINARLYRIRFASHERAERRRAALDEHHGILDALSERDGVRLARLLKAHQAQAWRNISEIWPRTETNSQPSMAEQA